MEKQKTEQRQLSALVAVTVFVVAAVVGIQLINAKPSSGAAPVTQAPLTLPAGDPNIFVHLAQKVVPSVVNIQTLSRAPAPRSAAGGPEDLYRRFFEEFFRQHSGEDEREEPTPRQKPPGKFARPARPAALGTGFIIEADGLILTNNHVVAEADEIKVQFTESSDEEPADAELVGRDPELDLALIRVKGKKGLQTVALGDSDALQVGEYVIAVGNPFGQGHSVTHGIISAKERKAPEFLLGNYLQTDAPINPGNSGGPLVNLRGEVIGINNAIDQRAQGIGFAIPINLVKRVLPQLKAKGSVARGYIGVVVAELSPEIAEKAGLPKDLRAPIVTQVYPDDPAAKAGVEPYDALLEFNGKEIRGSADLIAAVTAISVGEKVPLKIQRGQDKKTLQIEVAERPNGQKFSKKGSQDPKSKSQKQADVGMDLETLTPQIARELGLGSANAKGVVVSNLDFDGPAAHAGLSRGDVIVEVDRKPVKDRDAFFGIVKEGKSFLLRVLRADPQGKDIFAVVVLDLKSH